MTLNPNNRRSLFEHTEEVPAHDADQEALDAALRAGGGARHLEEFVQHYGDLRKVWPATGGDPTWRRTTLPSI